MDRPFFEETILVPERLGTQLTERYDVSEHQTSSGDSYAHIMNPYPVFSSTLNFQNVGREDYRELLAAIYHKVQGTFAGFRYSNPQDYTTNNYVEAPTSTDQICLPIHNTNKYQMVVWYGTQGDVSQSHRRIRKPVNDPSPTALASIAGQEVNSGFSVDYTTGEITFTDTTDAIGGITKGAATSVNAGAHPYSVGDSVTFTDVVGMTEINGVRGEVLSVTDANNFVVNIDSTSFTNYVSGGVVHTAPQDGEIVRAGCEFDIPVHFVTELSAAYNEYGVLSGTLTVEELLNP